MRRKRFPPDDRLDWRDPNMPVIRVARFKGEEIPTIKLIEPHHIRQYSTHMIDNGREPSWRNDPSYFWGRKKK